MTQLTRRFVLAAIATSPSFAFAQTKIPVAFHFFGAQNCPPCIAFKRANLPMVQASGDQNGFDVFEHLIERTEDIGQIGIYGVADPLLRQASPMLQRIYPPIFMVTQGPDILAAREGDWRSILDATEAAARSA
ncbi:MAG: hypothetical protein AAFY06_14610 [Pseudomonadota bacterium]